MFSAKYVNAPFMHDNGTGSLNASGTLVPTTGSSTVTVAVLDPEIAPKPELDTTALSLQDAHRVDGGLEAWSVIAGASVALFVQFGLGNSYGAFQYYYGQNQLSASSPQRISWIGSVQLFLVFFGGTFCGRTFDAYGPRALIVTGSILFVLSLFLVSFFQHYDQLMICQGVLFGVASSMIYNPCIAVMGQWFVKRRATAAGIVAAGAGFGGVVFPIMLSRLIPRIGFAWTVRTVAFMSIGLLSFSIVTVKARLPPRTGPATRWLEPLTAIRVDSGYRWFVIACFFGFMGLWVPFFYIGDFCTFHGFSNNLASYMLPMMNAGSVVGRLIGFVADKWGRFNLLTFGLFYLGVVVLAMLTTVSGHAAIIVYSVMFGLGSGVFIALFPACTAQISPPELIGSRLGFLCFVTSFATLTGPPIAGALIAHGTNSGYTATAVFSGTTMAVGAVCACVARFSISRDVWKVV